jgi:hypothetical protein
MERVRPGAGWRARAALETILAGRPDDAWASSPLTADGFPCEIALGSTPGTPGTSQDGGAVLRLTAEPPAASAAERLTVCEDRLAHLGAPPLSADLRHRLLSLQQGCGLNYGAWIGSRHDGRSDRYKLYVEVAARCRAADRMASDCLGHTGPHRRHPLHMVGYDFAAQILELYFHVDGGWPPDLPLSPHRDEASPFAALLDQPPTVSGFSLAVDQRLRPTACALFAFAADLLPQGRDSLLSFADAQGIGLPGYREITCGRSCQGPVVHGMLAVIRTGREPDSLRIGFAPPHPAGTPPSPVGASREYHASR